MASGADSTKANWQALRRLAALLFARLRRENPDWDFQELKEHLDLPDTKLFQKLAEEAGFEFGGALSAADQNRVLKTMLRGIFGPTGIARATKLPLRQVRQFLEQVGVPFGGGGSGMGAWPGGGAKEESDAAAPTVKPRRVSRKGQFSHGGSKYGLGAACPGGVCWVQEAGRNLIVHLPGRPSVTLLRKRTG